MTARRAFIAFTASSLAASCLIAIVAGAAEPAANAAATSVGRWRAGEHFRHVVHPQPTSVASGTVEVLEAFWYGCGHCYALDPVLEDWKSRKPANVEFLRMPVVWGLPHRQHAKLFYTLQALGKPELHSAVFNAVHREGLPLSAPDDARARTLHFEFLSKRGVTEEAFNAAYDSMTVAVNVRRAQTLTNEMSIDNVPLVFINGRYVTSVSEAGGHGPLLELINDFAVSEKSR